LLFMDLLCAGGGRRDGVAGSATGCSASVSHPRISLASGDVLRSGSGHERQHISYASIAVPHRDGGDSQRGADVCVVSKAKDFDSADRSRAGCRLKQLRSDWGRIELEIRELHPGGEHEWVVEAIDEAAGYHGIVAIHSTKLGPAVGGTRVWPYKSFDEALTDALRLSRGMTYKAALAGLPFGGGKSVIIAESRKMDRESVFRAHGRFINHFNGQYITGEDVGTTPADMELVRQETPYAAGLAHKSGDPSPFTAHGVFRAMQAAAFHRWKSANLTERSVAIQGCGSVGYQLARELHKAGARLMVTDIDSAKAARIANEVGAKQIQPDKIFDADAEILAPCALGGILNDKTIPRLRVGLICG